jgi:hypothetical protein
VFLITGIYIHSHRGLDGKLKLNKFRIDGSVRPDDSQNILKEFMSCDAVASMLEVRHWFSIPCKTYLSDFYPCFV